MADDVSHFSMVGYDLDVANEAAFAQSISEIVDQCEIVQADAAYELCLIDEETGGELWIGFSKTESGQLGLHTINPAFRGKGEMTVTFNGLVSDPQWEPFEYKISATFSEHEIPVLIELADPRERSKLTEDEAVTLDVTAFTYNPEIYKDDAAYVAAQTADGSEAVYASNHFIPSGLFSEEPTAHSIFAGTIREAELRIGADGAKYWWTLVETLSGATINVVFDDVSSLEQPTVGYLLVGEFWMTAHIVDKPK
ncbi:hypothetical protein [Pontixanthobacter sp. CEM42]|uniref:hypothetical protein n=1 Tax=Pontixanthobacter sp. CEM42 TaxID=2792077 RepID=UPI001ADF429E|nr:hypothetical protein [Pontixanthobacter sp. CEM42]